MGISYRNGCFFYCYWIKFSRFYRLLLLSTYVPNGVRSWKWRRRRQVEGYLTFDILILISIWCLAFAIYSNYNIICMFCVCYFSILLHLMTGPLISLHICVFVCVCVCLNVGELNSFIIVSAFCVMIVSFLAFSLDS